MFIYQEAYIFIDFNVCIYDGKLEALFCLTDSSVLDIREFQGIGSP